jgi:hypothetical protein
LKLVYREVGLGAGVHVLHLTEVEHGEIGCLGNTRRPRRWHAVWTDRLLRQVPAGASGRDVGSAVDAVERQPAGKGKEQYALVLAHLLQSLRLQIDGQWAIESEACSVQDYFQGKYPLLRHDCRLFDLRRTSLGDLRGLSRGLGFDHFSSGLSWFRFRSAGFLGRTCWDSYLRLLSGSGIRRTSLHGILGAIREQSLANRGVEQLYRLRLHLIERRREREWTRTAERC